jgi:hypothetical protein
LKICCCLDFAAATQRELDRAVAWHPKRCESTTKQLADGFPPIELLPIW